MRNLAGAFRSMSNPKLYGQPNTYGGANWIYPGSSCGNNNDNCGVHTNSGVLNHWFYRLVTGGSGTNDLGNAFAVSGIGSLKAAKIVYNTELALNSTATYASCRTVSIAAATALYGACSPEVEAVVRAWYAVGVGSNFVPCTAQISFSAASVTVDENANTNNCQASHLVSVPIILSGPAPVGGSATVTVTPIGGTATAGVDYDLISNTAVFNAGSTASQAVTMTIYDNGALEANKYVNLVLSVSAGSSNAVKASVLDTVRVIISSDDHLPEVGGTELHTVLSNTAVGNLSSPFISSARSARAQIIYTADELRASGVRAGIPITAAAFNVTQKISAQPFTGYTLKLANTNLFSFPNAFLTSGFTTVYSASTTTAVGWNTLPFTLASFTWDGTSNIAVEICFTNTSAGSGNDRIQAYSGAGDAYATSNATTASGCSLAFNSGNAVSARPVIRFAQDIPATAIATTLNDARTWNVKAGQQVYFYTAGNNNLVAGILQPSVDLGCVTATVGTAGQGFMPIAIGGANRSVKEITINPAQPLASVTFDGAIYLTSNELGSTDPNSLLMVQTTAATDAQMTTANTAIITPTQIIAGQNYKGFAGTFNGFNRFFLVDGNPFSTAVGSIAGAGGSLWTGANPFQKAPVLHWNLKTPEHVNIRLFDITGKLVYGTEQTLDAGAHQVILSGNAADYAPGQYILQVVRPSGVFTSQLVKQ